MTAEPPRLAEMALGPDSPEEEEESGSGAFDLSREARNDAGGRAMDAVKSGDVGAFVEALRDLMPFLED